MTLIDRLSKLDGPDPAIDADICILLQYGGKNSEGAMNVRTEPEWDDDEDYLLFEIDGEPCCNPIPEMTASVDAAIALAERVLPGWTWYLGNGVNGSDANGSVAGIYPPKSPEDTFKGDHPIAAIALCIAVLRAKEARHAE